MVDQKTVDNLLEVNLVSSSKYLSSYLRLTQEALLNIAKVYVFIYRNILKVIEV